MNVAWLENVSGAHKSKSVWDKSHASCDCDLNAM